MKQSAGNRHSIGSLFSVLLFALFLLFLLLLLLFSAQLYQNNVHSAKKTHNLYTAAAYLETKFRQHDDPAQITSGEIDHLPALLFRETLAGGDTYQTAIYLCDGALRELFFSPETQVTRDLGTPIAELSDFRFAQEDSGWHITLTDPEGTEVTLLLHPGVPVTTLGKEATPS